MTAGTRVVLMQRMGIVKPEQPAQVRKGCVHSAAKSTFELGLNTPRETVLTKNLDQLRIDVRGRFPVFIVCMNDEAERARPCDRSGGN
jgi:hypothetical protein